MSHADDRWPQYKLSPHVCRGGGGMKDSEVEIGFFLLVFKYLPRQDSAYIKISSLGIN